MQMYNVVVALTADVNFIDQISLHSCLNTNCLFDEQIPTKLRLISMSFIPFVWNRFLVKTKSFAYLLQESDLLLIAG